MPRRLPLIVGVLSALAICLGGCGSGASPHVTTHLKGKPRRIYTYTNGSGAHTRTAPPARAIIPPGVAALRAALAKAMHAAGPGSGAEVYDLTTHQMLYSDRANAKHPPASVEKLYTTTAVLRTLGPGATLQTDVYGAGHLGPHGVWDGDLYFKGGGDPTLGDAAFNKTYEAGFGPNAAQLAEQLQARGIRRVTGKVYGDESLFDTRRGGLLTNYAPDTPDFGGELSALVYDHGSVPNSHTSPAVFAAQQLVDAMKQAQIKVSAAKKTATTPVDATELATVSSPPMQVLLRLMDVPSDDLFAELLTKQLGVRFGGGTGSISAGANVISQTMADDYGIHPTILDGSGLSRDDRSSPAEVVQLLRELWHTSTGEILYAALPVVGRTGTVQNIAVKTAAAGRCAAKTGTLDDVSNLAGYCHARGGDELAFALFDDGPPNPTALAYEGQMVAAIARY